MRREPSPQGEDPTRHGGRTTGQAFEDEQRSPDGETYQQVSQSETDHPDGQTRHITSL
jgi:hypothetical protein